ncbi:MAG TPA: VCBS repeat-containing protein, partial [Gemmataceae bacterium]|nr:VCBS repeat-containing protein [Gemmataceae bacterium]
MRATRLVAWLAGPLAVAAGAALLAVTACNNSKVPVPDVTEQPDPDLSGPAFFKDVTADSGVKFTYRNGEEAKHYAIIESLGGGLALIDYDGDGLLDLFVTGGGHFDRTHDEFQKDKNTVPGIHGYPCKLYKNLGKFRFKDVTAEVGLDRGPVFYTHGAAVADFNRDGWPDLLVTGWGRMALYRNDPVDPRDASKGRKFTEVGKEVGLPEGLWTTSAAWADLDGDGYPDLYVCQYVDWDFVKKHPLDCKYDGKTRDVCPPKNFYPLPHHLLLNKGGKQFVDVSLEAGVRMPRTDADYDKLAQRIREQAPDLKEEDRKRWVQR